MSDKLLVWLSVEVSGNDTKLGIGLGRNEKPRIVETKRQSRLLELQVGPYSLYTVPKVCILREFRLMKSFRMSSSDNDVSLS